MSKAGQERIRRIRNIPDAKPLTFVASSLSQISDYARISDDAYHVLRRLVPGGARDGDELHRRVVELRLRRVDQHDHVDFRA